MTFTPRKSFWPKRWVRSFAGAALATAVVGGAVWAADPPPGTPPTSKEAAKDAPKPLEPKAKEEPKAAPAPKQKLLTFTMSGKPWKDVKTMKDDPAAVEKMGEEIKERYTKLFRV